MTTYELQIAGNLGFLLVAASYAVRDMLSLRILGVIAALFLMVYNYYAPAEPLWLVIRWNAVFVAINTWSILSMLRKASRPAEVPHAARAA